MTLKISIFGTCLKASSSVILMGVQTDALIDHLLTSVVSQISHLYI